MSLSWKLRLPSLVPGSLISGVVALQVVGTSIFDCVGAGAESRHWTSAGGGNYPCRGESSSLGLGNASVVLLVGSILLAIRISG